MVANFTLAFFILFFLIVLFNLVRAFLSGVVAGCRASTSIRKSPPSSGNIWGVVGLFWLLGEIFEEREDR